jgi:hypothetical protein
LADFDFEPAVAEWPGYLGPKTRQNGRVLAMSKPEPEKAKDPESIVHPGMMGDGTEEQNLNERGDPAKRITEDEVDEAFAKPAPKKP